MPVSINLLPCSSYLWLMLNIRMCCWSIYPDKSGLNSLCCLLLNNTLNTISTTHSLHCRCLLIANLLIRLQKAVSDHRNLYQDPRNLFRRSCASPEFWLQEPISSVCLWWQFVAPTKSPCSWNLTFCWPNNCGSRVCCIEFQTLAVWMQHVSAFNHKAREHWSLLSIIRLKIKKVCYWCEAAGFLTTI